MSIHRWLNRSAVVTLTLALAIASSSQAATAATRSLMHSGDAAPADEIPTFLPSPETLQFPARAVSTTSPAQTITFTNTTPDPQTVATVTLGGDAAADFAITGQTCTAAPIAADGTCTVDLTFTPGFPGVRDAHVDLTDATPKVVGTAALEGVGQAVSNLTWGTAHRVRSLRGWSYGSELARSVTTTGTSYLQAVYTNDYIGGHFVTDHGPYLGVYYTRSSSATGASWSKPVRLNPTTRHGDEATIATSGKYVYVAWTSQTKYVHFSPSAPRALYIRVNPTYGKGTWRSAIRLTSSTGRIYDPHVAAAGKYVYVSYTDSNTGKIRVKVSSNHGKTWRTVTLGRTTLGGSIGKQGGAIVAASGANVVVAWAADADHRILVRRSTNHGSTWTSTQTMSAASNGLPDVAVSGSRAAVIWSEGDGVALRVRTAAGWGPVRTVAAPDTGKTYQGAYSVAVSLNGSSRVGVAWSACWFGCGTSNFDNDLLWAESADDGETWFAAQDISTGATTEAVHDGAAIVWPTNGQRTVIWNAYDPTGGVTTLQVRTSSGTP